MKYTISNISHEPHDMDEDIVFFNYDIHFTEPEAMSIKNYFYPYSKLLRYLEEKHPDFYQYLNTTRNGLDRWGPAEVDTLEAIGDEALQQLYGYLEEYLLQCDWMEEFYLHEKEQRSQPVKEQIKTSEKASEIMKDLSSFGPGMKKAQNRYYRFCETVEKQIRQTAMEVFPEIANLEPEELKKFKYLFVREIQRMHERIEKLLAGKEEE